MPPEIKKIAEEYVKDQLAHMGGKFSKRKVDTAVEKVAKALYAVRVGAKEPVRS